MTGWASDISEEKLEAHGIARVLTKPFRTQELLDAAAALLRERREGS